MSGFGYDHSRTNPGRTSTLPVLLGAAFTFVAGVLAGHWLWG